MISPPFYRYLYYRFILTLFPIHLPPIEMEVFLDNFDKILGNTLGIGTIIIHAPIQGAIKGLLKYYPYERVL